MGHLSYSTILKENPLLQKNDFRNSIYKLLVEGKFKIVILDDDPTGIQTVHNCLLITKWNEKNLTMAFEDKTTFFYVLTNSRSLNPEEAEKINIEVVNLVLQLNQTFRYNLIFISRSDSTLRGHFPLENEAIRSMLKSNNLPTFFIPSFLEVGRFTIDNIHYLKDGDNLIPVSETEFAGDNVFGYQHSNLEDYIVEKSKNKILKNNIKAISLTDLRTKNITQLSEAIETIKGSEYIIINALDYYDLQKFALALLQFLKGTQEFGLLRTSSSFPKALSGIEDKPLLTKQELIQTNGTGIFVVGSHVKKTTLQLKKLLESPNVRGFELNTNELLNNPTDLLQKTLSLLKNTSDKGITPVIYTSRKEIRLDDKKARLEIGKKISGFIVDIIKNLPYKPTYLVAKGGITSNDILSGGLDIEVARVMGQIVTGVPVIMTDKANRYPNLPYIIFPGNVGDENSLLDVFDKLN